MCSSIAFTHSFLLRCMAMWTKMGSSMGREQVQGGDEWISGLKRFHNTLGNIFLIFGCYTFGSNYFKNHSMENYVGLRNNEIPILHNPTMLIVPTSGQPSWIHCFIRRCVSHMYTQVVSAAICGIKHEMVKGATMCFYKLNKFWKSTK